MVSEVLLPEEEKNSRVGGRQTEVPCYHCGTSCSTAGIRVGDKAFCCDGCKLVFELIDQKGLCDVGSPGTELEFAL